jgi:hypothetical protein
VQIRDFDGDVKSVGRSDWFGRVRVPAEWYRNKIRDRGMRVRVLIGYIHFFGG